MPALKKQFFPPVLLKYPQVKGVCIQECVTMMGVPPENSLAHTHVYHSDQFLGWICFKDLACIADEQVVLHELAHLLTTDHHIHDSAWRKKLVELGGHMNAYTFSIGPMGYDVPCVSEKCALMKGQDPEERMTPEQRVQQDEQYAKVLELRPTIIAERDKLVKVLNSIPIDKSYGDGPQYVKRGLEIMRSYSDYDRLIREVTIPLDTMF